VGFPTAPGNPSGASRKEMQMPTAATPHKGRAAAKSKPQQDASAQLEQAMTKLGAMEAELVSLLERSLCDTLHATGDVAKDVNHTVRALVGAAFAATREVSESLLQSGARTAEAGRSGVLGAAATVQDFGRLASEAARQVLRGAAEGIEEIRASRARQHHS
jgi:hypothetical protein